jgi:serine/threonine protein kinase
LPTVAAKLQNAVTVIACPECGTDNDVAATTCTLCNAQLGGANSSLRALLGQTVLSVYTLLDVVGKGGMSVVYKAKHKITDQIVALKILPAELAVHSDIKARFVEEAKALAKLEHPNIVRLYNFGEQDGRFVLAMQYVDGTTFERKILAAGRLDWKEAVGVVCQLLQALDYAHRRGIVHRDIKPSNVLVRPDGTVMVMDFGIAKMAEGSTRLTATGQTMGTVRYMSPEQVRGKILDHRSDLYSVGVSLYEALVGDTPFDGTTHFEIMMKHLNELPPALHTKVGADVPKALEAVLAKAMSKDPRGRYQTAGSFLDDLEAVLEAAGSAVPGRGRTREIDPATMPFLPVVEENLSTGLARILEPSAPAGIATPRRRWVWAAAAVAVAAAAVTGWQLFGRQPAAPAAFPDPYLVAGLRPVVDKQFATVRVLAARAIDADHMASAYAAAAQRFAAWVKARGDAVDAPPVNVVLAPAAILCAPELHQPADCATRPPRFVYPPRKATLYVLDDARVESVNLVEGVAAHMCWNSAVLLEKGCSRMVLPAYWDEVEK